MPALDNLHEICLHTGARDYNELKGQNPDYHMLPLNVSSVLLPDRVLHLTGA